MKNIIDYIEVFERIVPYSLCDEIINEYENSNEWEKGTIGEYNVNLNLRTCDTIFISKQDIINNNPEKRKQIDNAVYAIVSNYLNKYLEIHSLIQSNIQSDSGYSLLRYKENQFIGEHIDASGRSPRELSCSIILNDNYVGGEFSFFNNQKKYDLKKGDLIMFPSNFMYPHEVLPVTQGVRYSIITWLS